MVVAREASFTPDWEGVGECERGEESQAVNNLDIWRAVVMRCNGVVGGECVFDLAVDFPESVSWGRGRTDVRYSCQESIHSSCGGRVDVAGEEYISSPGYPRYYLGGRECVWTLVTGRGQQIMLAVLDLSLRESGGGECHDWVTIREEGGTDVTLCGHQRKLVTVLTTSPMVTVRLVTGDSPHHLYSHRGLLLQVLPQGCPPPPPVADGRLVQHNTTHATLTCNHGHVLQSTLSPVSTLHCSSYSWTPVVAPCVSTTFLIKNGSKEVRKSLEDQQQRLSQALTRFEQDLVIED